MSYPAYANIPWLQAAYILCFIFSCCNTSQPTWSITGGAIWFRDDTNELPEVLELKFVVATHT